MPSTNNGEKASLSRSQWQALDDLFAEMCERSHGQWEDLHDRARGVLETVSPASWRNARVNPSEGDPALQRHVHEIVGALLHLAEAAPGDRRAIRVTGRQVCELGERMLRYSEGNGGARQDLYESPSTGGPS